MTKLTTVLFSLCFLILLSCSEDEEENFLTPLVGTWQTNQVSISGCTDTDDNGVLDCTGGPCFMATINSNGTYTLVNNVDQESEAGEVTVTSTQITFCPTGDTDCSPISYSLSGSSLTVTFTEDDSPGCLFSTTFTKQ